ncbi:hypothetical protein VTO73DRAFT_10374 [Trametes versicolor]
MEAHSTVGIAATKSTLFDLGDASTKRTSTLLGDLETPSPSPKRMKHEARSPGGTTESLDSAAQRVPSTAGASTRPHSAARQYTEGAHAASSPRTSPPMKSANFWYPDGNVVIKGDETYHKLHSPRLARYCVYFIKLFADDVDDYEDRCAKVESCPVYHIPANLDSDDFEKLLIVLGTPLRTADAERRALPRSRRPQAIVRRRTETREEAPLCNLRRRAPPEGAPSETSPAPSSLSADTAAVLTYHDAVFIILFARRYGLPELLKRAFYKLLTSAEFWAALTADRKQIRLTEDDLLRL